MARSKPRRVFLLVGCIAAVLIGVGLFTSIGTGGSGSEAQPAVGVLAPTFALPNVDGSGSVGSQIGDGRPTVILFFAAWCEICHTELPSLAKAVAIQQRARSGPLRMIQVIGVDSVESAGTAEAFARASGVTFPVGLDSGANVLSGAYGFVGPPYAVFVTGNGKIVAIHPSSLSVPEFKALEERALG